MTEQCYTNTTPYTSKTHPTQQFLQTSGSHSLSAAKHGHWRLRHWLFAQWQPRNLFLQLLGHLQMKSIITWVRYWCKCWHVGMPQYNIHVRHKYNNPQNLWNHKGMWKNSITLQFCMPLFYLCSAWLSKKLTHSTSRSRFHLEDKDTAFHKLIGNHMDCTAGRAGPFFL